MAESVYKVIELVGTSEESWNKAASAAVAQAAKSLRWIFASPKLPNSTFKSRTDM